MCRVVWRHAYRSDQANEQANFDSDAKTPLERMCRYRVTEQLGDGTYGSVWKAINRETNEVVR